MDNFREWLSDNLRYILLIIGVLAVLVGLFFGIRFLSGRMNQSGEDEASSKEIVTLTADSIVPQLSEAEPVVTAGKLEENAVPEVTEVMKKYYAALSKQDLAGVMAVVDELPDSEAAPISSSTTVYSNIRVYTKPGPDADSYVVYTRYDYKNENQPVAFPGLTESFVRKDASGDYKIVFSGLDDETSKFIAKTTQEADVQALISEVKKEFDAVQKSVKEQSAGSGTKKAESSAEEAETETSEDSSSGSTEASDDKSSGSSDTESGDENEIPPLPEGEEEYEREQEYSIPDEPETEDGDEDAAASEPEDPSAVTEGIGTVTGNVNVRSGPDRDTQKVGEIPEGSEVEVTGESDNGWRYVRYGDVEGYIAGNYLDYEDEDEDASGEDGSSDEDEEDSDYEHSGTILSSVNVRSGPGFDYEVLGTVPGGAEVTVYGDDEKGWWHISSDSLEGYVGRSYISVS